jgi:hypothetical protein
VEESVHQPSVSHGPIRDLEERRISPEEYARRVRREVRELVRESHPPKRVGRDNGHPDHEES